ncbi:MAG TPA: nucleotidyltransferase family protein [Patescibacteria group bacterium]
MTIDEVKVKAIPILKKYGAEYAAVFGSVARGDDRPDSDIDFVVRLSRPVGFFKLSALETSLEQILQRPVDLVEEEGLSRHMKPYIIKDLVTVYEK